jgi:hypothetical protein
MKIRTMWMVLLMCGTAMAAPKTMQQRLDAKLPSLKIANQPLVDALATLGKASGLRLAVDWESLEATGVKKADPVNVTLTDIKASTALNVILAKVRKRGKPLSWVQRTDAVYVSTQATILSAGKLALTQMRPTPARTTSARTPAVKRKMKVRRINLKFTEQPLSEVLQYYQEITRVNMYINWGALQNEGIKKTDPVTLTMNQVTIPQALNLTMKEINGTRGELQKVYWILDGGVLTISSGTQLNTTMRSRVYDVADLLKTQPDFEGTRVDLAAVHSTKGDTGEFDLFNDQEEAPRKATRAELRERNKKSLVKIVQDSIGDQWWQPNGKGSVRILRNQMIVSQSLLGFKLMANAAIR